MKSRDTLIRLKRFHVDEKRRRVSQIETMIAEFQRMAGDLDREIENEERRAGKKQTPARAVEQRKRQNPLRGPNVMLVKTRYTRGNPSSQGA